MNQPIKSRVREARLETARTNHCHPQIPAIDGGHLTSRASRGKLRRTLRARSPRLSGSKILGWQTSDRFKFVKRSKVS